MIKVAVSGISGRMGQAICRILQGRGHKLGVGFDIESSPFIGKDAGDLLRTDKTGALIKTLNGEDLSSVDGIIDFTAPEATLELLELAVEAKKPLVIGTTGINKAGEESIRIAAENIPILYAPNMSVGVNILFKLTELAAKSLPDGYDVEVFEAHHKMKKDAPSGTARRLIDILKKYILRLNNAKEVNGRDGIVGDDESELGVQVMRGGDIVGEHTVFLVGMGERIEITHRATNRDTFAEGSVRALEYIIDKEPGLYTMYDVLGL
jgi:4-hydroxy-tetrahydrodipicolinate reductase